MLSRPEIYERLSKNFIALRFDWEQGDHYKDKFGFILGTGDQLLLDPNGNLIPPCKGTVYGRHGCDLTGALLDDVSGKYSPKANDLRIDWFWWNTKASSRKGGFYPPSPASIATYARLPIAKVEGPVPAALNNSDFLRWHVRQFIWVRGSTNGASRITLERVKDGLSPGLSTELAVLDPNAFSLEALGHELDHAWFVYMKDRPLAARGYLENPHGAWMHSVKDQMLSEESEIRRRAKVGTLLPPGRKVGERPPYLARADR
ncbi:MAG TPA: hypothetical protein VK850_15055 [Candidatus Binatia bacterium]|nr:hypothetical protein [Candidatus Binatia bacterium]